MLKSFSDGNSRLFVKASGLPTNTGDTSHFSNVGLREIGRRFGYQIANYLTNIQVSPYSINANTITTRGITLNSGNVLNAYVQGTFTATFINPLVSGSGTYSNNNCSYTLIGRVIYFTVRFNFARGANTYSSNNIEIQLGNLPLPVSTRNAYSMGFCVGLSPQIASFNKFYQVIFTQSANENVRVFRNLELSPVPIKYDEIPTATSSDNCEIQFSGFYFV